VRASYRWQPSKLVTAVDPYSSFSDQAFLSFQLRQPIQWGMRLPKGLDATIDVTNLLAEGYRPFVSADGQTLYFAQAPRTVPGWAFVLVLDRPKAYAKFAKERRKRAQSKTTTNANTEILPRPFARWQDDL